jgi:methionine-rich copper-binding protein CopC
MIRKQLISFAVGLFCLLATAMRADAHAFLIHAEPQVGSKMKKAPNEVRIWFNEPVQQASSTIKVFSGSGKQVDKKDTHLDRGNRALLHVSLTARLASGTYKVIWRVTSVDTHITNGDFRFQIAP